MYGSLGFGPPHASLVQKHINGFLRVPFLSGRYTKLFSMTMRSRHVHVNFETYRQQSTFNSAGKQQNPSMLKKQRKTVTLLNPSSHRQIIEGSMMKAKKLTRKKCPLGSHYSEKTKRCEKGKRRR